MTWHSFRVRTALLAASLAGLALMGFAIAALFLIQTAQLERLDAKISVQMIQVLALTRADWVIQLREAGRSIPEGDPFLQQPPTQPDWPALETSIRDSLAIDPDVEIALLAMNAKTGTLYYQSPLLAAHPLPAQIWDGLPLNEGPESGPSSGAPPERKNHGSAGPRREPPAMPPIPTNLPSLKGKAGSFTTATGTWRVSRIRFVFPQYPQYPNQVQVAIAVSQTAIDRDIAGLRNAFLIIIPTVLAVVLVSAWVLAGRTLRPIQRLTHTMRHITARGLDQRIPTAHTDIELVELIQVFNQMLERLDRSFHQALRFSGDAAHELKTPLAILQGELEHTIQHLEDGSPIQQTLSNLLDEVRRLSGIVRKLLLLSLADAGQMRLHYVQVDLAELLQDLVEDIALMAPELSVRTDIDPHLKVRGDRDLLTQVLQNLISNAIKYNQPAGWIHIQARPHRSTVQITIRNASQDIPVGDRSRIFDRFHRGDPARTRTIEGVGLGLSLAREIARTHGGKLTLDSTPPGETAFTFTLSSVL